MICAMPDWLAIVLRPFALVVLLIVALYVSRAIEPLIPPGRIKRALYARHEVVPSDPASVSPRTRRISIAILLVIALLIAFKPFRYLP